MENHENGRLRAVIERWGELPECAKDAIFAFATSVLDLEGYEIAGRMIDLLTAESPDQNALQPG